jgi:hypothetical protein
LYFIFKCFCVKDYIPVSNTSLDKRNNEIYSSFHFVTLQLPCFNEFRELFYIAGKKVIPNNIYELLTPKGLAF